MVEQRTREPEELSRLDTVGRVIRYFSTVIIVAVALMLILGELGISVAPILATAGVAGVAIGFGAQSLVKDYLSGFFILLEDQIRAGDVVEVAGKTGEVEELTLRYVRLRDAEGIVYFIPNGEIKMVVNRTRAFAYALIDAAVAGHEGIGPAIAAMTEVGQAMRKDAKFGPMILEDLQVWGVDSWELWGLNVRGRIKTLPRDKDTVRREFLKRLVGAFEAHGIKQP